jgi:hypothetical protein
MPVFSVTETIRRFHERRKLRESKQQLARLQCRIAGLPIWALTEVFMGELIASPEGNWSVMIRERFRFAESVRTGKQQADNRDADFKQFLRGLEAAASRSPHYFQ